MIKTLEELATELNKIFPTRYSHFSKKQEPPFIVYIDQGEENFHGDNVVCSEGLLVDVELYSRQKDLTAERRIKDLFRQHQIPYDKGETFFVEDENLYGTIFSIILIDKYPVA